MAAITWGRKLSSSKPCPTISQPCCLLRHALNRETALIPVLPLPLTPMNDFIRIVVSHVIVDISLTGIFQTLDASRSTNFPYRSCHIVLVLHGILQLQARRESIEGDSSALMIFLFVLLHFLDGRGWVGGLIGRVGD